MSSPILKQPAMQFGLHDYCVLNHYKQSFLNISIKSGFVNQHVSNQHCTFSPLMLCCLHAAAKWHKISGFSLFNRTKKINHRKKAGLQNDLRYQLC